MKVAEDLSLLFCMLPVGRRRDGKGYDEGDGCNHGIDLSITNGEGGLECLLLVKVWLHITRWGSPEPESHAESIDWLMSYFLMTATKQFLNGNIDMASVEASFVSAYEQYKAVVLDKKKPEIDWHQVNRILNADKPALAAFLRKRIPCACLD